MGVHSLGMVAGNAQAAQGLAFMTFPQALASGACVPVESMPGWLQAVAEPQPVAFMVDAVSTLVLGPQAQAVLAHGAGFYVVRSLLWTSGVIALVAPLAVARYRRG